MKIKLLSVLPALVLSGTLVISLQTVSSQTQSSSFAIIHANVIDGVSNEPLRDVAVIVRDGKIEQVGKINPPAEAAVLDLKGKWLLPGFVDAHAHIANLAAARLALQSGVTTARDLGVNHFFDIGVRELNHAGVADLPDVVAAGYHVRPRPAEELFIDIPKLGALMEIGRAHV